MTTAPGILRIVSSREASPGTHEVRIERVDRPGFEFVGSQYIIVNTGVTAPNGKPAKRAYSLVPCPEKPGDCTLTVKRIGVGSEALTSAVPGTELSFSGPWGKLVSAEDAHVRTLFVATDTGITAALSAAERRHPNRAPSDLEVLWLRSSDDPFLGLERAQERFARAGARWVHTEIPSVLAGDRVAVAHAHVEARIREFSPGLVLAAGDGNIVHPLRTAPRGAGIRDVRIECFFHNPERKAS